MSNPIQVSPPTNDLTLSKDQTLAEVVKVTIPKLGIAVLLNLPKLTQEGFGASFLFHRRPLTAVCNLSSPQA